MSSNVVDSECRLMSDASDCYDDGEDVAGSNNLLECVLLATHEEGKEAVVKLLSQDPVGVKNILCELCANEYLLHNVCLAGNEELVSLLIGGYYVDINADSPLGTPLSIACEHGYECVADALLGCDVRLESPLSPLSSQPFVHCPFYQAAYHGWINILKMLIESEQAGREKMFHDRDNCLSILYSACIGGHESVLEYCLETLPAIVGNNTPIDQLANICLSFNNSHLLPKLFDHRVLLRADICETFETEIGVFLRNYVVSETDDRMEPQTDLSATWSRKGLCSIRPAWLTPFSETLSDLVLSDNHFTSLPSLIPWSMPNLKFLVVCRCGLQKLSPPSGAVMCNRLERLALTDNKLSCVPVDIFCVASLLHLDLSGNDIAELCRNAAGDFVHNQVSYYSRAPRGFNALLTGDSWSCVHLRSLNVSKNCLRNLPNQLHVCGRIESICAAHNKLTEFIKPWKCHLKCLDLSYNQLSDVPIGLDEFWSSSLISLKLSHNKLTRINQSICRLASLKDLDVAFNLLVSLPSTTWWTCKNLDLLNLAGNHLGSGLPIISGTVRRLKTFFGKLQQDPSSVAEGLIEFPSELFSDSLSDLNLSRNGLQTVPSSVCKLTRLVRLDLSLNPDLNELPNELCHLYRLEQLYLDGSKLTSLRKQCADFNTRNVMVCLKQKLCKSVANNRLKLMIVGSQNKGKTTLSYALQSLQAPQFDVATDGVVISEWELKSGSSFRSESITVQMWDFAGQRDYYVTHKVFLSSSAIYLLVFDLRLQREGVCSLKPWLSDIQAHAPNSYVIIVGSFLDCLGTDGRSRLDQLNDLIDELYAADLRYPRSPNVHCIAVSGKTKENIPKLKQLIFTLAKTLHVKVNFLGKELLIGKMVPLDYIKLAEIVISEADRRTKLKIWPVLNDQEFWDLVRSVPNNSINTQEELNLAIKYLHEAGYILHFASHVSRLKCLHFISPQWLGQMLAKFFTLDGIQRKSRGGIIELADVELFFFKDSTNENTHCYTEYCIDLLESFDIALRIDGERLLLPSKLPAEKPGFQLDSKYQSSSACGCLTRLYAMAHVPSGFWSRLLVQLIGAVNTNLVVRRADSGQFCLSREFNVQDRRKKYNLDRGVKPKITYWQTGICLDFNNSLLFIESAEPFLHCRPIDTNDSCCTSFGEGVLVTVLTLAPATSIDTDSNILLSFATDRIESLITHWYPGLQTEAIMERLIPCPSCMGRRSDVESLRDVKMFPLADCARKILTASNEEPLVIICDHCPVESSCIRLKHIIPDLFLLDVTSVKHIDLKTDISCNAREELLGSGGEGQVYKGTLVTTGIAVAVKKNWLVNGNKQFSDYLKDSDCNRNSFGLEQYWRSQILEAFGRYRQETSIMSSLQHENIISLVGVSVHQLAYVMELCPGGDLRQLLEQSAGDNLSASRSCAPSNLDRRLAAKITHQMAAALSYLHSLRIVYKDMKPENILVWSTKVEDKINIKLADYGLAQLITQQGVMGVEGTPGYQAPEMRDGRPYDEKVDIYAFGMVVFEIMTGYSCHSDKSVLRIARDVDEGRFSLHSHKLIIPQMASLISSCWSRDPSSRPSAAQICELLGAVAYCNLDKIVHLPNEGVFGKFCALHWTQRVDKIADPQFASVVFRDKDELSRATFDEAASNKYLRMWTNSDDCHYYHLFNMEMGQFKVKNHGRLKSQVVSMIAMKQVLVAGTQNFLHLLALEGGTNELIEVCDPYYMGDTPIMLIPDNKGSKEFFAGFKKSGLQKYCVDASNVIIEVQEVLSFSESLSPVSCALWIKDELWVGAGSNIAVFASSLQLCAVQAIFGNHLLVSALCGHDDQVWILGSRNKSSVIVEMDTQSRCIVFVLDCSRVVSQNDCITVSDYQSVCDLLCFTANEQKEYRANGEGKVKHAVSFSSDDLHSSRALRRKLTSPFKRRNRVMSSDASDVGGRVYVTAMAFVDGLLWIGLTSKDILLVNVTQNNCYGYDHGEVLAKLCPITLDFCTITWGSVLEIVHSGQTVITLHQDDDKSCSILKWTSIGLEAIHHY